jgi:HD-GYP domain-containing protein (c-di-GMP phosphodiesterase class II)
VRVSRYGMMLTSLIEPDHADDLQFQYGFLLHDVGKLTVPDVILTKAGPLTEDEWEIMRGHPAAGRSILDGIPFLAGAREIVYAHHERWDGKGYPVGLSGDEIPLGAQIFPLCDAFDAMTSDRPYRKALSVEVARKELVGGRGTQFRPDVVDAFLSLDAGELDHVRGTSSNETA